MKSRIRRQRKYLPLEKKTTKNRVFGLALYPFNQLILRSDPIRQVT